MASHSLLRDEVMKTVPTDAHSFLRKLIAGENVAYLLGLDPEQRRCMVGLGGSQKAEVAWLDKRQRETGNDGYRYTGFRHHAEVRRVVRKLELDWEDVLAGLQSAEANALEAALAVEVETQQDHHHARGCRACAELGELILEVAEGTGPDAQSGI
jgi:hypothetical protein